MEKIYEMKLGDCIKTDNWEITRVPGGWIYVHTRMIASAFVRYDNEFYKLEREDWEY